MSGQGPPLEFFKVVQNLTTLGILDGLLRNPLADGRDVGIALIDTGVHVSKLKKKI